MADNKAIATNVLAAVGGKDNVASVSHCITRLRFVIKDEGLIDEAAVKKLPGVMGAQWSGGQYQVIVGQNVTKVYDELCALGGFEHQAGIDENLDGPKEKLTLKRVGDNALKYISGSMIGIIPVLMAAAMFKMVAVIIGPDLLNLVSTEDDLYVLMNMVYNAGFYFLPVYLGFTAAKQIGATPIIGAAMGCVLIEPTLVSMVAEGGSFSVYGIPMPVLKYSQTVLPILLSIVPLYFVEKFFKKVMPDALSTIFTPFLTLAVMLPISLCILSPIGSEVGNLLGNTLFSLGSSGGVVGVITCTLLGGFWEFFVMTGMHTPIALLAMANQAAVGYDTFVLVMGKCAFWATAGMAIGAFLRLRNKDEKALAFGSFVSAMLGGITEPALFGVGLRYRHPFVGMIVGGMAGGLWCVLTGVKVYAGSISNVLGILLFLPGGTANFVMGTIGVAGALVIAAIVTYLFGFSKESLSEAE